MQTTISQSTRPAKHFAGTQYALFYKRTGRYYSTETKALTDTPEQRGQWDHMCELFIADESRRGARESGELILIAA